MMKKTKTKTASEYELFVLSCAWVLAVSCIAVGMLAGAWY